MYEYNAIITVALYDEADAAASGYVYGKNLTFKNRRCRWMRLWEKMLRLIAEGKIDTAEPLITHTYPLSRIEVYDFWEQEDGVIG